MGRTAMQAIIDLENTDAEYCLIETAQLRRLILVAKRLYSEQRMTGDEMRNMAQTIYEGVLPHAMPYTEPDDGQ